ncbi:MAG TPA: transcription initiation factor IIB family protein [Thermoplasmata archaeon]|nr:transcription initiation factor IIB family protein [Thermoplasmata archaeon]
MSRFDSLETRNNLEYKGLKAPEERQVRETSRCPNCGSFAIYLDPVRGERVCDNCGFVVDEGLVDQGPDWTTFEGDDRIRAGPPPSVMAPDKGLGSMVGNGLRDAKGNPIDARSVAALNRLRRVSQWTRYDRTERALAPGLAQLSSLSSRLGLAPVFRERAAILLRQTIEAGLSRGRSMDAIVAAVVYLAAKQLGAPRGLHELAQATGVTVHRISLTAKVVSRELGVFSRASRAEDFVPRFASQLELNPQVGERALSLVARVKDTKTLEANSPVGIAAGALYLASEELDVPMTQAQIARLTGVSEVTIRKHYRLLKELIDGITSATEAA